MHIKDIVLENDHTKLIDSFVVFLGNNEKYFFIDGPGGAGKTTIVKYLIEVTIPDFNKTAGLFDMLPRPEYYVTAMHNKASAVLNESGLESTTIHHHLGLALKFYKGNYVLSPVRPIKGSPTQILFIDECSTMDSDVYNRLLTLPNAKIVFIGDRYQAPPVGQKESLLYATEPELHCLKKIRRTTIPEMASFFEELREQVEYEEPMEIPIYKDLIVESGYEDALNEVVSKSHENNESFVVLGYTNSKTRSYNKDVRAFLGKPEDFVEGDVVIINSAVKTAGGDTLIPTDTRAVINKVSPEIEGLFTHRIINVTPLGSFECHDLLTMDFEVLSQLQKEAKKEKNWHRYYYLKENVADLRHTHSLTIHKSQGSSYDNVVIDLSDLKSCTDNSLARKLLYVAVTRARKKVILIGTLPERIGETRHVPDSYSV